MLSRSHWCSFSSPKHGAALRQPLMSCLDWGCRYRTAWSTALHVFEDIPLILTAPIAGTWEAVLVLERRELKMLENMITAFHNQVFWRQSSQLHSLCKILVRNTGKGLAETLCSRPNCVNKYLGEINFLKSHYLLCSYSWDAGTGFCSPCPSWVLWAPKTLSWTEPPKDLQRCAEGSVTLTGLSHFHNSCFSQQPAQTDRLRPLWALLTPSQLCLLRHRTWC